MSLVDRFICRREGHVPSFKVLPTSVVKVKSWVTTCQRCGKAYEITWGDRSTGSERDK